VISMANRMNNNGKLGQYNIRERTKVSFVINFMAYSIFGVCQTEKSERETKIVFLLNEITCKKFFF
jgi:hypothetical protein